MWRHARVPGQLEMMSNILLRLQLTQQDGSPTSTARPRSGTAASTSSASPPESPLRASSGTVSTSNFTAMFDLHLGLNLVRMDSARVAGREGRRQLQAGGCSRLLEERYFSNAASGRDLLIAGLESTCRFAEVASQSTVQATRWQMIERELVDHVDAAQKLGMVEFEGEAHLLENFRFPHP